MSAHVLQDVTENVPVSTLFSLKGKVALVTGGAGRYGRQISTALAEAGATVVVASRCLEKCEAFATSLRESGLKAHACTLDLTSNASVEQLATEIETRWHKLDILFNNAVAVHAEPFDQHSVEDWSRTMECNSTGLYRACRIFGQLMAQQRSGSIINVASIYGVVSPEFGIYDGHSELTNPPSYGYAKAGMVQLTRYFAVYFGKYGVRVNSLSPGGLHSAKMPKRFVENYSRRTPLGRMAGPNDLKGAAVFLASDASAYVTGHNLLVDGGYTAV
ncbi:MAG TPA: SDR family oxidoreductase [Candidatus Acidoferrales bacterium]|nr:SDR family oxidoreductase [Candidatus Acidoferrales bacterium]